MQVRETIRTYWVVYLWCLVLGGTMIGCWFAPPPYRIRNIHSVFPMCWVIAFHVGAPIMLNPVLMLLQW